MKKNSRCNGSRKVLHDVFMKEHEHVVNDEEVAPNRKRGHLKAPGVMNLCRKVHRFGLVNVRSLLGEGKVILMKRQLEKYGMELTALVETRWKDKGVGMMAE